MTRQRTLVGLLLCWVAVVLAKQPDASREFRQPLRLRDAPEKRSGVFGRFGSNNQDNNEEDPRKDAYLKDDEDDGPGILMTLGGLATALLPSPRHLSDLKNAPHPHNPRERPPRRREEDALDNRRDTLSRLWENAPLPLRVVGNLVTPYLSRVAHNVASDVEETQEWVALYLRQAHQLLTHNEDVLDLLGGPLLVAPSPFSEKTVLQKSDDEDDSSCTTTTLMEMSFTVTGSKEAGVAYLKADSQNGLQLLRVTTVQGHKTVDVYSAE